MGEDMYCQTRLFNRNSTYYYRAKIPVDLQGHYGKTERKFSLKTKDRAKAAALVRQFAARHEEEYARIRTKCHTQFQVITHIDDEFIRDIRARYRYAVLQGDECLRTDSERRDVLSMYIDDRPNVMPALREALARGDTDKIKPALNIFLLLNKFSLACSDDDYERLAYAFLKETTLIHEKQCARDQGQVVENPEPPASLLNHRSIQTCSWDQLIKFWTTKEQARPAKTVTDVTQAVNQFRAFLDNKHPDAVTEAEVEAFRDTLFNDCQLQYKTVLKKIRFLSSVYQVAVDKKVLTDNPACKINVPRPRFIDTRQPYNADDLRKIFTCPLYTDHDLPRGGGGEAAVWLPRLALYTGCRLEELAQLRLTDIGQEDGILYLNITADTDQHGQQTQLKNTASIRRIPLHSKLLEAGFAEYYEKITHEGQVRLFPELSADRHGKLSGNWSKWWGRYVRQSIGITDKRKVFHSFRHSFRDACREAELTEELCDALMGHSSARDHSMGRHYGAGFSIKKLKSAIERLTYPVR